MRTNMIFQVPDLLFNIGSVAETYGTWPMPPFRASGIFRKNLTENSG
jgi:hypothetical protein